MSNIDESSTRKGIFAHFQQNGVRIHELNLFRGRNNKCYAQVVVDTEYSEKVESDNFGLMEFTAHTGRPLTNGKNAATNQTNLKIQIQNPDTNEYRTNFGIVQYLQKGPNGYQYSYFSNNSFQYLSVEC